MVRNLVPGMLLQRKKQRTIHWIIGITYLDVPRSDFQSPSAVTPWAKTIWLEYPPECLESRIRNFTFRADQIFLHNAIVLGHKSYS